MSSSAASPGVLSATRIWDELILAGASTLDQKEGDSLELEDLQQKPRKVLFMNAGYVFKGGGLNGVWGISNRVKKTTEAPATAIGTANCGFVTPSQRSIRGGRR